MMKYYLLANGYLACYALYLDNITAFAQVQLKGLIRTFYSVGCNLFASDAIDFQQRTRGVSHPQPITTELDGNTFL